jgi:tRNA pseudouridine55 synthase
MDGILLIDKPVGITSSQCVARVRRTFRGIKVGHAGTLDPDATGVLVILLGRATRLSDVFLASDKEYTGTIKLGCVTTTDDLGGNILQTSEVSVTHQQIEDVRMKFLGEQSQIPPQVSAVKVDGKRAYKRSLRGEQFSISPRTIQIYDLSLKLLDHGEVEYHVHCSKGTYVRALARDMGEILGCGACIKTLRRIRSGHFEVNKAVDINDLGGDSVIPWYIPFSSSVRLRLSALDLKRLNQGEPKVMAEVLGVWEQEMQSIREVILEDNAGSPQGIVFWRKSSTAEGIGRIMFGG